MKVPLALLVLLAAGAAPACRVPRDLATASGDPTPRAERDAYVLCRADAPAARLPEGRPATLAELLRIVEDGAIEVQQARAQVEAAAASVDAARADLLPNLAVGASGRSYAQPPGSSGFRSDREVADATIDLSVPLDVSGRIAASVRAAQARYRSESQRLRAKAREQRLLVTRAYFILLEAHDLAEVNEATVRVQEQALREGRARLDVGTVRRNDVLVLEVALSNSRQRSVALASAVLHARRALNAAAGLPVDHPTMVAPFDTLIPAAADVVPFLDRARYDNPEVDVLVETRTALLQELIANARSDLPEVSIGPRLTATTEGLSDPGANLVGFISVSWNPDLNGRLQAERRGLKAQLIELAWTVTGLLRLLEERILRAHQTTVERETAFRAAVASLSQAEENLRLLGEQFRLGISTGREVLEAQSLLAEQRATVKTARNQTNAAQFELRYLAGIDPIDYAAEAEAFAESRPESR